MTEKIIGYSLLATGILLMIFAVIQIIFVFTGKAQPISIFSQASPKETIEQKQPDPETLMRQLESGDLSSLMGSGLPGGLSGFGIDASSINKMLNLTIYYFIMQFILSLGYKLASLGVQMVRPMHVTIQRNKVAEMIDDSSHTTQESP